MPAPVPPSPGSPPGLLQPPEPGSAAQAWGALTCSGPHPPPRGDGRGGPCGNGSQGSGLANAPRVAPPPPPRSPQGSSSLTPCRGTCPSPCLSACPAARPDLRSKALGPFRERAALQGCTLSPQGSRCRPLGAAPGDPRGRGRGGGAGRSGGGAIPKSRSCVSHRRAPGSEAPGPQTPPGRGRRGAGRGGDRRWEPLSPQEAQAQQGGAPHTPGGGGRAGPGGAAGPRGAGAPGLSQEGCQGVGGGEARARPASDPDSGVTRACTPKARGGVPRGQDT